MTSRYSTVAVIGAIAALVSTTALVLFRLYESGVAISLMKTVRYYDLDGQLFTFIGVTHFLALALATFALIRPTTILRVLLTIVAMGLAVAGSIVAYYTIFILFWLNVVFLCKPSSACNPVPGEIVLTNGPIFLGFVVASAALTAILNRRALARDTAVKVGLLLLALLPFVSVIGLVGTGILSRRNFAATQPTERVLLDA